MNKPSIQQRLTRIHLWMGEHLGLTRYASCWDCKWVRTTKWCVEHGAICANLDDDGDIPHYDKGLCWCWKVACDDGDGCPMACCPSEAVWCADFESIFDD